MKLGEVVGTVVSTIVTDTLRDRRLLVCDLLGGDRTGVDYVIAVDVVGAGAGETVLIMDEGNSARQILSLETAPIRAVVVGIVDQVDGLPLSGADT